MASTLKVKAEATACAVSDGKTKTNSKKKPKAKSQSSQGVKNKQLGRKGEEAAARYLHDRGYEILERNWTCFAGEADIIAQDAETIVFIEVKTRKDCQKGFPSEAVTAKKREKYEKIALAYLGDHDFIDMQVRFDVIAIVVMGHDRAMLRHQINAFLAA